MAKNNKNTPPAPAAPPAAPPVDEPTSQPADSTASSEPVASPADTPADSPEVEPAASTEVSESAASAESGETPAEGSADELVDAGLATVENGADHDDDDDDDRSMSIWNRHIERIPAQPGFAFMEAPDDVASASVDGKEYTVDRDQCVEVPIAAIASLLEHGFTELEG